MNTMRFLAVFAIVGFFGFINAKEWRETPSVEKRLETQINIAQKIAEIKAEPVEVIPANLGGMKFKILTDEDGFYTLYLGDDKTNVSINSPADFSPPRLQVWKLSIKLMRYSHSIMRLCENLRF